MAEAAGSHIKYVYLPEETGFRPGRELLQELTADTDMLFVANPNNPTGQLMGREYLQELLEHCRQQGITVVVDECFIEFCESGREQPKFLLGEIGQYENLLLARAFTKSFAMPGVRLGYLVCSNAELREKIRRQLPEWNLSVFAQRAGIACAEQSEQYLQDTVEYVKKRENICGKDWKSLASGWCPEKWISCCCIPHSPSMTACLQRYPDSEL